MPRDFTDATSTSMQAVNSTDTEGAISLAIRPPSPGKTPAASPCSWYGPMPPRPTRAASAAAPVPNRPFAPKTSLGDSWWPGRRWKMKQRSRAVALYEYRGAELCDHSAVKPESDVNIKTSHRHAGYGQHGDHVDSALRHQSEGGREHHPHHHHQRATALKATRRLSSAVAETAVVWSIRQPGSRWRCTELTTTQTEYRGVTDANGNATVVVTQSEGPGVKTPLSVVSSKP